MMHIGLGQYEDGVYFGDHQVMLMRNIHDSLLWYQENPPGTDRWSYPCWSNKENYFTATALRDGVFEIYFIKIDMQDILRVLAGGDFRQQDLWIPSMTSNLKEQIGRQIDFPSITITTNPLGNELRMTITEAGKKNNACTIWLYNYRGRPKASKADRNMRSRGCDTNG
jgi:hypothetical protein